MPRYKTHHRIRRRAVRRLAVSRTMRPSVQGALIDGDRGVQRREGHGAGRRPHRRRRACARPGRAFRSVPASATPTPCATRSTRICGRIRSRSCRPRRSPADFDARRSAVRRHYLYRIVNRRPDLALERGRAWRVPRPLDAEAMHAAAQRLVGKHDFTTFRSTECQAKSPEKTLDRLDVVARRRRDPHHRRGALVPAQPGALDGRLAGAGRRRQMERRRSRRARSPRATARPAGRWRRRTGFIWCGWIIEAQNSLAFVIEGLDSRVICTTLRVRDGAARNAIRAVAKDGRERRRSRSGVCACRQGGGWRSD